MFRDAAGIREIKLGYGGFYLQLGRRLRQEALLSLGFEASLSKILRFLKKKKKCGASEMNQWINTAKPEDLSSILGWEARTTSHTLYIPPHMNTKI